MLSLGSHRPVFFMSNACTQVLSDVWRVLHTVLPEFHAARMAALTRIATRSGAPRPERYPMARFAGDFKVIVT